jgi:hypothetical protein
MLRLLYAINPVPNQHPVTKTNKITTDSPDHQLNNTVVIVHLHQAHHTQTMAVPEK